jgi:hypothetical protein
MQRFERAYLSGIAYYPEPMVPRKGLPAPIRKILILIAFLSGNLGVVTQPRYAPKKFFKTGT